MIFFQDCADPPRRNQQGIEDPYKVYSRLRQILFLAICLLLKLTCRQYIFVIFLTYWNRILVQVGKTSGYFFFLKITSNIKRISRLSTFSQPGGICQYLLFS